VGDRIGPARLAALLLGLAGMAALTAPDARALWEAPAGTLLMLAAAVAWAIGTVLTKASRWTMPTAALTGWQVVLGGVPIALGAILRAAGPDGVPLLSQIAGASSATILGTAYATFVGAIFCHWAWFRIVSILPAATAAIGTLGIPIVGVFASALVLGEPVGPAELLALGLVVAGLAILVLGLAPRVPESPAGTRAVSIVRRD
jgi:drug/metabolite transporter (DMT)-like permease